MLTVGSLFSGIGGFDLGLERAGMRVIWQSEIDPYACAVLRKHWPDVPNHGDVRAIIASAIRRPDVICGGFPCNDTSNAGRRSGLSEQTKSGLWSEMLRVVRSRCPQVVLVENSAHGRRHWLDQVRDDLEDFGYSTAALGISAADIGANHERRRCFVLADASSGRLRASVEAVQTRGPGVELRAWWAGEPALSRVDDGVPRPMDRARRRALGNAIVPQIAEIIGRAIVNAPPLSTASNHAARISQIAVKDGNE